MPLKLTTYYHGSDIPELPGNNTFHSIELFHIYEATPGYTPASHCCIRSRKACCQAIGSSTKECPSVPARHYQAM